TLDLSKPLAEIFSRFHKDSVQRRIRRAEGEGLGCETGNTEQLLNEFYDLLLKTRRRHLLPPQPIAWFRNLLSCLGDKIEIRVARKGNLPIAALLSIQHRSSVIYKYGCSNESFHHIGAIPFLFWRMIYECKARGIEEIDFGRSDVEQKSLITFKERFGARKSTLTYYRYPVIVQSNSGTGWHTRALRSMISLLPDAMMTWTGKILYKHMG